MLKRNKILYSFLLSAFFCAFGAFAQEVTFDQLLEKASQYPVQFDDPASIQKGLSLYHDAIRLEPQHPRRFEAELQIYEILRSEGDEKSLGQASVLIERMVSHADLSSSEGQDIAFRFVEFHLNDALGYSFQSFDLAGQKLGDLIAVVGEEGSTVDGLHTLALRIELQIYTGEPLLALDKALSVLTEMLERNSTGFSHELWDTDLERYAVYVRGNEKIAEMAGYAAYRSNDIASVQKLKAHPLLLISYPVLRKRVAELEKDYLALDMKEFDQVADLMAIDVSIDSPVEPPASSNALSVVPNLEVEESTQNPFRQVYGVIIGILVLVLLLVATKSVRKKAS